MQPTKKAPAHAAAPADAHALTTAPDAEERRLHRRRRVFFSLVGGTVLALVAAMTMLLLAGGLAPLELAMLMLFALTLPWLAIGLWNAVIGFLLLRRPDGGLTAVFPPTPPGNAAPACRTAIVVPVHDEDPPAVMRALRATIASLDATGHGRSFDVFLLSDTRDEALAARERELFAAWQRSNRWPGRLHYRRRPHNTGFKAGNIADFCRRCGGEYELMLVLDADSVMTGPAILRLVRLMQANPRLGILQTLIVGLPSTSAFARIFQFGIRHGMRAYTMGSAWWQGDAGPYWGHNAMIRLRPFIAHCRLPRVPGRPPLGGDVLSHDQIEAVLMRKAGWEVRVLPLEDGSYEANPPTLLDFAKRDLRWCQGNMQYTRLLNMARRHPLGRLQMVLAVLMYTGAPCWLGFCLLGLLDLAAPALGMTPAPLIGEPAWLPGGPTLAVLGPALLATVVVMSWAPKLMGTAQILADARERRRYGGGGRVLAGSAAELVFASLLAPVISIGQTIFIAGLLFGRRLGWRSQARADRRVGWGEAARRLWPQTLLGAGFAAVLAALAPAVLPWAAPMIAGLLLAVPFAVLTASPRLGRVLATRGLCATPEERASGIEVRAACPWLDMLDAPDPAEAARDRALAAEPAE